jgi:hypothetical protein
MPLYTVKKGDCIDSIAYSHGLTWEQVWNHPDNSGLSQQRDPNVLLPGDQVFVPPLKKGYESAATEQRHRYRLKDTPAMLHLRLVDDENEPRAGIDYTLNVNGHFIEGRTDDDGCIDESIRPNTGKVILTVRPPPPEQDDDQDDQVYTGPPTQNSTSMQQQEAVEEYEIQLGAIDPASEIVGIQERLHNLGYELVEPSGELDQPTQNALRHFQGRNKLEVTGILDDATKQKLEEIHRS